MLDECNGDVSTVETLVEHERCRGLLSPRPGLTLNFLRLFTIEQFFRLGRPHHAIKTLHDVAVKKTEGTDSPNRCPRSMSHM